MFDQLFESIKGHTLVDKDRCFMIYQLMRHASCIPGDVAEVGVYKGGTAKLIAKSCGSHSVFLFDTFEGMLEADSKKDLHKAGDFADTSEEKVKQFLGDCPNAKTIKGFFPETGEDYENRKFCFVYIDVDIYKSIRDCCEFFYPRMNVGGIIRVAGCLHGPHGMQGAP